MIGLTVCGPTIGASTGVILVRTLGSPPVILSFMCVDDGAKRFFGGVYVLGPFEGTVVGGNPLCGVNIFGLLLSNVEICLKEKIIVFLGKL